MQYIGLFAVMLAALLFSREYAKYMKKRERECEAFLEFMAHLRLQVGCYLRPLREVCANFSSPPLESVGFLEAVSDSENIYMAYEKVKKRFSMSEEELKTVETLFSSLGTGYLEEQMKLINMCEEEMRTHVENINRESPKKIKLISTLSVTLAMGFFILVI